MARDETKKVAKDLDELLRISSEEIEEWDTEELILYSINLGGIDSTYQTFRKMSSQKNSPNHEEIKTKIEILKERYLTEARRRDTGY